MTEQSRRKIDSDFKFYANATSVYTTIGEFYIRFGRHDPKGEAESIAVYIPAVRAKQLLKMLKDQIGKYEKIHGELKNLGIAAIEKPKNGKKEHPRDVQYQ